MKILFICNLNQNRSKTAEEVFSDKYDTRSAGLYNDSPVTAEQIEWAETVIVMEEHQRKTLAERFPKEILKKRVLCLDIPDTYFYMQQELIDTLKHKMNELEELL